MKKKKTRYYVVLERAQGPTLLDCNYADACFTVALGSVLAGCYTQVPHRSTLYQHVGVQFSCHHPPRHEDVHGRQGPQGQLSLNWTIPDKVLAVGPCSSADTSDGSPLGAKLLYLDLPSDRPTADARRRVLVQHCKSGANPRDRGDMPKCLPAGLTQYVLKTLFKKFPPYHVNVIQDDISTPLKKDMR